MGIIGNEEFEKIGTFGTDEVEDAGAERGGVHDVQVIFNIYFHYIILLLIGQTILIRLITYTLFVYDVI